MIRRFHPHAAHALLLSAPKLRSCSCPVRPSSGFAQCQETPATTASIDLEDLYRFTIGRFVVNEAYEMAQRYAHFDINQLARIAAEALGSSSCVKAEQLPEGMHNKALLLMMEDGKQAVARIPNSSAGKKHFTTASEVATMNYARDVLQHPVPKIYSYNCDADQSPVGGEFIIMEKAQGVPLDAVWKKLKLSQRWDVTRTIVEFEKDWSLATFHGYRSLYHAADLPDSTRHIAQPPPVSNPAIKGHDFVIGPTTGRDWISDGRLGIDFDRGPWETAEEYLEAIGRRELACVEKCTTLPKSLFAFRGPNIYETSREKKSTAIQLYLDILPSLIPTEPALKKPCMWHSDLHEDNISVDPSNPTEIISIIDWQSTQIAPMFSQARQPYLLDYEGPQHLSIEKPELPDNFEQLPDAGQRAANVLRFKQALLAAYRRWHHFKNPDIWKCFEFQATPQETLLVTARKLFNDGEATYIAAVIDTAQNEPEILGRTGERLLSSLGSKDLSRIVGDVEDAMRARELMQVVLEAVGGIDPRSGFVHHEDYEEVKDALSPLKEQVIGEYAGTGEERARWKEAWPFDD